MKTIVTDELRTAFASLADQGFANPEIAQKLGLTKGQTAALRARRTMRMNALVSTERALVTPSPKRRNDLFLGLNGATRVVWNPTRSTNPHLMIVGESGSGKTFAISRIVRALAKTETAVLIFDYSRSFEELAQTEADSSAIRFNIARSGVRINPLQILESDIYGPVTAAQRLTDVFTHVFPQLGVQQANAVRDSLLRAFRAVGIDAQNPQTWNKPAPSFSSIPIAMQNRASDDKNADRKSTSTAAARISELFLHELFHDEGIVLDWNKIVECGRSVVLDLADLPSSTQRVLTECLLWDLLNTFRQHGSHPYRLAVVLDEAHRMSFAAGSAIDLMLREGRKFGIGLILSSQQPEDFSPAAISNTSSKLIFRMHDRAGLLVRFLVSKQCGPSARQLAQTLQSFRPGQALAVSDDGCHEVTITSA